MDNIKYIGNYNRRTVIQVSYEEYKIAMPDKHWLCFMLADHEPDSDKFAEFVETCVQKDIVYFCAYGKYCELVHDRFDENFIAMEVFKGYEGRTVMTTWDSEETLADAFWFCFTANLYEEGIDSESMPIVVIDMDGVDRVAELRGYINRFKEGWLPSDD